MSRANCSPLFLKFQEQGLRGPVGDRGSRESDIEENTSRNNIQVGRRTMARDTADFAQQSSERAMQAANFGMIWGREFAEESSIKAGRPLTAFCAWRARWPTISRPRPSPPASTWRR